MGQPYLEAMGGQGWELVAAVLDGRWADFAPTFFFKRPTWCQPRSSHQRHGPRLASGPTTDPVPHIMGLRTGRRTTPIL